MADFEYFRAEESDQFSFFRIPKALFTEKEFASLSTDAKLLYDRLQAYIEFCLIESAYPRKMAGLTVMVMSISFTRLQNCRSCCECRIQQ